MVTRRLQMLQALYNHASQGKAKGPEFMILIQVETPSQLPFLCLLPEVAHVVSLNCHRGWLKDYLPLTSSLDENNREDRGRERLFGQANQHHLPQLLF